MARHVSKFEFACEVFGYNNAISMDNNQIDSFYNDWKSTTYSLKVYKNLLKTRG